MRSPTVRALTFAAIAVLAGGLATARPSQAAHPTVWLCRPGLPQDPCRADLTATLLLPTGATRVVRYRVPARPRFDCFYVYPTVSAQPTVNASLARDPEVLAVARAQASRFATVCRVFAPVYRQVTLAGNARPGGPPESARALAFGDVEDAWREYLRRYNHGRPYVLIGHSQGARMLLTLLKRRFDARRSRERRRLISALLIGGNVVVRRGSDRGGDLRFVPACRRGDQYGCVVAYSAFFGEPPADSRFGIVRETFFRPADPRRFQVLCTDPARLSGHRDGALLPFLRTQRFPGPIGSVEDPPAAATPWVGLPDLYADRCRATATKSWLQVIDRGGPSDRRPRVFERLGPTWGLHLLDVNLALGNLVELVARQARAFERT